MFLVDTFYFDIVVVEYRFEYDCQAAEFLKRKYKIRIGEMISDCPVGRQGKALTCAD